MPLHLRNGRVFLILDANTTCGQLRLFQCIGHYHSDMLPIVIDLRVLERQQFLSGLALRLLLLRVFGLAFRGLRHLVQFGHVEVCENCQHPRQPLRLTCLYRHDQPTRNRALHHDRMGKIGKIEFRRIPRCSRHLLPPVDPIQWLPDHSSSDAVTNIIPHA